MRNFEIKPGIGVGPIMLGMERSEVEINFGQPEHENGSKVGYFSGFMISYSESNKVEFIELANSESFTATFEGKDLHNIPAEKALEFVCNYDSYDENEPELGYSYTFKKLQLSLWRGAMPESENDREGKSFEAVGIGEANYFV